MRRKGKLIKKMSRLEKIYKKSAIQRQKQSPDKVVSIEKKVSTIKNNDDSKMISDLVAIAIEIRKLRKKFNKLQKQEQSSEGFAWFGFSLDKIEETLAKNKITLTDYTWHKYIEWMNTIEIISVEHDESMKHPMIMDTISPLIEVDWKIYARSKVIILSA